MCVCMYVWVFTADPLAFRNENTTIQISATDAPMLEVGEP